MSETIRISEIFGPTIQGEGALIGQPTVFVRTGGCDYRCTWCDTLHAVDTKFRHTWKPMTTNQIWEKIEALSGKKPLTISLSGGNPAIQPFDELLDFCIYNTYRSNLETQGSISQSWFSKLDTLTLSPKPPSSDMEVDWDKFDDCIAAAQNKPKIVLKIVIGNDEDYDFSRYVSSRYSQFSLYLQPCNTKIQVSEDEPEPDIDMEELFSSMRWLVDKVRDDQWYDPIILPQLHVLLWGNMKGV